jgi:hypothetical protein
MKKMIMEGSSSFSTEYNVLKCPQIYAIRCHGGSETPVATLYCPYLSQMLELHWVCEKNQKLKPTNGTTSPFYLVKPPSISQNESNTVPNSEPLGN